MTDTDALRETGWVRPRTGPELYYEVRGEGPPLVILNNFFMTAPHWRPLTRRLEQQFTVVNYDLRHQGRSGRVDGAIALGEHVGDLGALLDHLGLERTHLLGTCISTLICRDFAVAFPERVKSAVLVGPIFSPFGDLHRKFLHRALINSLRNGGGEALFDHYYPLLYTAKTIQQNRAVGYLALKTRFLENNPDEQLLKHLQSTVAIDDDPALLAELRAPTLLLCGEEDFLTSRQSLTLLTQVLPDARYQIIEGAAHNPYLDATAQFEAHVIGFLREREALAAPAALEPSR